MAGRNLHAPILPLVAIGDPTEHARRRKAWNRGFSTTALKEYVPIITRRAGQLLSGLRDASNEGPVDLAQWISYFA